MIVSYIKRRLSADVKLGFERRFDKTNVSCSGGTYCEMLENHVDFTAFGCHDFRGVNNSLFLAPYHPTFV